MTVQTELFNYTAFFEGLSTRISALRELRKAYDEQMAFDFIATRFFRPNENKFSEILAFFLDPEETHGQGDTFLRVFCEKFLPGYAWKDWLECGVVIRTEHITSENRRIDITIKLGEQFIVGIENKIYDWTAEQAQQAEHYCNEMYNTHPGQFLLLYLTPNGLIPSEHSISKRFREELEGKEKPQFRCISYREDIHGLLEQWATACKAPTVESFIGDFNKYIQYEYIGVRNMDMEKSIVDYLIPPTNAEHQAPHPEYIDAALDVHASINELRKRLWARVRSDLKNFFDGLQSSKDVTKVRIQDKWEPGRWIKAHCEPVEIHHDNWQWFLCFNKGRCNDLYFAISFQEGPWGVEDIKNVKNCLPAYHDFNEKLVRIDGYVPIYRSWLDRADSTEAWKAMNRMVDELDSSVYGKSEITALSKQIIDWYREAQKTVTQLMEV